jgi:hypothetical protein
VVHQLPDHLLAPGEQHTRDSRDQPDSVEEVFQLVTALEAEFLLSGVETTMSMLLKCYGEIKRIPTKSSISIKVYINQLIRGKGLLEVLHMKGRTHAQQS